MTNGYEICCDPFDPTCVIARSIKCRSGTEEDAKRFLERIRGKEVDMIHNYTPYEEYELINEQIRKSQGFDVDFSMFRALFNFFPSIMDENHSTLNQEADRVFFRRLAKEAISNYNARDGTSLEFVEVEKANIYEGSGYTYFITFLVKNPCDDDNETKIFQAKVLKVFCREIVHCFCRQKPDQQENCYEEFKEIVKKRRIQEEEDEEDD